MDYVLANYHLTWGSEFLLHIINFKDNMIKWLMVFFFMGSIFYCNIQVTNITKYVLFENIDMKDLGVVKFYFFLALNY
jgi:hypothetical protein